jgi:hypothetical protein
MKKLIFNIFFIFLLLLSIIVIIESISWVAYQFTTNPSIKKSVEYALNPEEKIKLLNEVPSALWHHELPKKYLNHFKTLGPDFQMPKPADVYRVICLGDSTSAFQGHHPQFLQAIQHKITYQGKKVEVINAGIPGHCSAFTLSYFALRVIHFQPDMILLKIGYNDYLPFTHKNIDWDYSVAFPEPFTIDVHDRIFWKAARHSYFLRWFGSRILDLPGENLGPAIWWVDGLYNLQKDFDLQNQKKKIFLYSENIRSIIYLCQSRGIRVVLLDLPQGKIVGIFREHYHELISLFDVELKKIALEEGVDYLETKLVLQPEDFKDHCHLKPSGGLKIAQFVVAHIFASG